MQSTIDDYTDDDSTEPPIEFSGPTSRRPIPEKETRVELVDAETGDRIDKRRLPGTGLAPDDLLIERRYLDSVATKPPSDHEKNAFREVMASIHASASVEPDGAPANPQEVARSV